MGPAESLPRLVVLGGVLAGRGLLEVLRVDVGEVQLAAAPHGRVLQRFDLRLLV